MTTARRYVAAKVILLALLPHEQPKSYTPALALVNRMDDGGFGICAIDGEK